MIKKVLIGIIGFILGISFGFYFEGFFREIIQDIFRFTTSDKIQFVGKNISIFSDRTFEYILGFALMTFLLANIELKKKQILKNVILCLLIFGISIFLISAINANLKVVQCTACDNGIVKIHWNNINFGLTIGLSAIFSVVPNIIVLINKIKASVQHSI
ncbi:MULTISPECIES: hypothetical protein [Algibacter]|uniref:Uncharacterized protein n=1 Tax=Algibacter lectus TaxID=221126 RepID=A0A4R8MB06_9FLAO|nr:hypothetical protein [Algibacter lectus]MWW25753.1 hypothetical protein [Algibacter lectus]TDY61035.1 hypothetical protein DFQ06_3046 [Algibacter lectus]